MSAGGAEREARERKEIARKIVAQYNAGFIDQRNNTPRPGLVKMIADALEKCANEARLEALEQAAGAASMCDIRAIGEGAIRIRIAEKIRALKAATEVK